MYVVDITRGSENDIILGENSMDAKKKVINYVQEYLLANHHINFSKETLDHKINIERFSLQEFLASYSVKILSDLKIQAVATDKEHCLFLKFNDNQNGFPKFYCFGKKDMQKAQAYMRYLVNESLLEQLQDNLDEYDRLKMGNDKNVITTSYPKFGIRGNIISLYNKNISLKYLLNSSCTLNDIAHKDYGGIKI